MAEVPARHKRATARAPKRNVLRKAADSDIHPAEPRTGGGVSSSRGRSSGAGRTSGGGHGTGGGSTSRD
jgi:hypothetical protein